MRRLLSLPVILLVSATAMAGPYDSLLKVVPSTANTLVLINSEAIFKSDAAKALNWSKNFSDRFRAGATTIPPDSKRIVLAASTNPHHFEREWQVALSEVQQVPNAAAVASREGGTVDEVAGRAAALSPRQTYFTTISEKEAATWYPANRQLLAHWIKFVKTAKERTEPAISPYLKEIANAHGDSAHLVISLDLTDAFDFATMRAWIEDSRTMVTNAGVNKEGLAKMVSQIRGLTLSITVTDKLEATLQADFSVDAAIHKTVLKPLLLEAFEDEGLSLGDLAGWDTTFVGKSMIIKGNLEATMLSRILTPFEFPQEDDGSTPSKPGDKPNAEATKKYFKAVVAILNEVKALKDKKDYEKTATWHETYAQKINQISIRGVDPEAVKFANGTAERLRLIANNLKGVPLDVKTLAEGAYAFNNVSTMPGWGYGGGMGRGRGFRGRAIGAYAGRGVSSNIDTNIPQTRQQINKVIADEEKNRTTVWSQIENAMVETRQKLSQAYGGGF